MRENFAELGAEIVGVSPDSVQSHKKFADKLSLPFNLLSDPEHKLMEACGAWRQKKMAGLAYMGVARSTALIDPAGTARRLWPEVKVRGHAEEVLAALKSLLAENAA